MSVNRYKDGQLTLIAGSGDSNTFTGTKAEVEQAIAAGKIKENWTVYITDDLEDIVNTPGSSNCNCKVEYLTQADYNSLTEEEKMNGTEYRITDNNPATPSAKNMAYDSSASGLSAVNVQDAIDKMGEKLGSLFLIKKSNAIKITVPASGNARILTDVDTATPTGYTLVGISTLSHSSFLNVGAQFSSSGFYIVANNIGTSEVKDATVTLYCMYMKNDLITFG